MKARVALNYLRTPLGRRLVAWAYFKRLRTILKRAARLHRRTLARRVHVTAIGGSFGKTTTARATAAALGLPVSMRLAFNSLVGLPQAVLRLRPWQAEAVIEVGINRIGHMVRQASVTQPDAVVMTGVGSEHLDGLGSLETVQGEKALLLAALRPPGLAVLNGDDPRVLEMADWTDARVVTYGFGPANDVRATDLRLDWPHGTRFVLHALGDTRQMRTRLLGRTMVSPLLAAVAVAISRGRALDDVVAALEELEAAPGRLQPVELADGTRIVRDDSKGSVETVHAAFDVLAEVPGRRILVMSVPPPWPPSLESSFRKLGPRMAEIFEQTILVGEAREGLAEAAREAGMPAESIHPVEPGARAAIETLRRILRPGDTVLLKGRLQQRLERIAAALQGRGVGCDLRYCGPVRHGCDTCSMLARGWQDRQVLPDNLRY